MFAKFGTGPQSGMTNKKCGVNSIYFRREMQKCVYWSPATKRFLTEQNSFETSRQVHLKMLYAKFGGDWTHGLGGVQKK